MPVPGPQLVRAPIMIEGQLELLVLAGNAEEIVGRLQLTIADNRELTPKLQAERLVKARLFSGSVIRYIVCK